MNADLIMKQQEKKHKQQWRQQKNTPKDTTAMNVFPVINISLDHCNYKRTKERGEKYKNILCFYKALEIISAEWVGKSSAHDKICAKKEICD